MIHLFKTRLDFDTAKKLYQDFQENFPTKPIAAFQEVSDRFESKPLIQTLPEIMNIDAKRLTLDASA